MSDVTVSYMGDDILELSDSGSATLKTGGTYCEADIEVEYVKPSGGGLELLVDQTATENVAVINIGIPSEKQTLDVYNVVLNGSLSTSEWLYPQLNTTTAAVTGDAYYSQRKTFNDFQIRIIKANSAFSRWYLATGTGSGTNLIGKYAATSFQNILLNLYAASARFSSGFNVKVYGGMLS